MSELDCQSYELNVANANRVHLYFSEPDQTSLWADLAKQNAQCT